MPNTKKLATAALAGLLAIGVMSSGVAMAGAHEQEKSGSMDQEKEKHACKGQNSCAGQGADGKNSCKGKGSCATDGSHPDE